jgi:hypothetical protein
MTGPDLWQAFLTAGAPDNELRALGEDIGYKRDKVSPLGARALVGIADKAGTSASILFARLKEYMPHIFKRQALLEQLAEDYDKKLTWALVDSDVREYLTKVAVMLPAKAAPKPAPAPSVAKAPAPAPAPSSSPSTTAIVAVGVAGAAVAISAATKVAR